MANVVQSAIAISGGAFSFATAPARGNLIVIVFTNNATIPLNSIQDNQGNVYSQITEQLTPTTGDRVTIFYAINYPLNNGTFTITGTAGPCIAAYEVSGIDPYNPFITSSSANGSSSSPTVQLTTGLDNSFIFVAEVDAQNAATYTGGNGYTVGQTQLDTATHERQASEWKTVNAGIVRGNFTTSATGEWAIMIAAFKPAGPTVSLVSPVKISSILGPLNSNQASNQLIRTSTNNLYAVIIFSGDLTVWKSSDNGLTWVQKGVAGVVPASITAVSAAVDGNDVIHIVYMFPATVVMYAQFSTATDTLTLNEKAYTSGGTPTSVSITVDSNNKPHIATTPNGQYSNRVNGFWKTVQSVFGAGATSLDIQIDQNNVPQVSDSQGLTIWIGNKNDATGFTTSNAIFTPLSSTTVASLAIDINGNTWVASVDKGNRITLFKHVKTDAWTTWQPAITSGYNGKSVSLAADAADIYVFYERSAGGIAYDRYDTINGRWLGEQVIVPNTNRSTTNIQYHNPFVKWSQYFNNGDTGANNQAQDTIEFLFDDGTNVYYYKLVTAQLAESLVAFNFLPGAGATTTSTSSTSSSTSTSTSTSSTSTSTSISTSSTSSSTSTSRSTSTSSTSTSTSTSTSVSTTSSSISTSSTSQSTSTSSTSQSTSTSSTSSSTSTSISTSTSSTSTSTSRSTSTSSTSTSISTSSTSSSISTSSTSSSISTSSTSTSQSTSTSSTSTSVSTSTSISTSSTSSSTSISTSSTSSSTSTSSTSTSRSTSTSSTSQSTSTSSTSSSQSTSTSSTSTSQSTSTSISTSSTSTSTTVSLTTSTSSTSSSTSTSSTSSSTSISTSTSSTSTSKSTSTSSTSTSQSTSTSISSTSSSTSLSTSTSSTSQSTTTSQSTSTSSTSTSTSVSFTTSTSSTSSSISSTSSSTSTTTTIAPDFSTVPFTRVGGDRLQAEARLDQPMIRGVEIK